MAKNLFSWQAYLWLCKLENNVLVTSMRVEQTENPILQKKKILVAIWFVSLSLIVKSNFLQSLSTLNLLINKPRRPFFSALCADWKRYNRYFNCISTAYFFLVILSLYTGLKQVIETFPGFCIISVESLKMISFAVVIKHFFTIEVNLNHWFASLLLAKPIGHVKFLYKIYSGQLCLKINSWSGAVVLGKTIFQKTYRKYHHGLEYVT